MTLIDNLISLCGTTTQIAERRLTTFTYTLLAMITVMGCAGLWNGRFTAFVALLTAASTAIARRAQNLSQQEY